MNNNVSMTRFGNVSGPFKVFDGGAGSNGLFAVMPDSQLGVVQIDASQNGTPEFSVSLNNINCAGALTFGVGNALAATAKLRILAVAPELDFGANGATAGSIKCLSLSIQANTDNTLMFSSAGNVTIANLGSNPIVDIQGAGGILKINSVQVLKARITGWADWTGTVNRAAKATGTATTADCAQTIAALIADLKAHGLLGT